MSRIRLSIQDMQDMHDRGDTAMLDNLVKAFRGIQALPPSDPNSFEALAGLHGEPFRGFGAVNPNVYGGFCNHNNILFPTWHRVYLLKLENALRSTGIPGCENVTLPFWDETRNLIIHDGRDPIPACLTEPLYPLDGRRVPNPLYSYKLQQAIVQWTLGANSRYSKPAGYTTVRYPLSGLVGTPEDRAASDFHNKGYPDPSTNTTILNGNVRNWLEGTVVIPDDPEHSRRPDTYSVYARFLRCLQAPNYTVFSNIPSQNQWIKDHGGGSHYTVSLESPHNAIHLAVGGFYQAGVYNADPIRGANGDMGANEMAGFDPIFYLHHCFIDYVFWQWQKRHRSTAAGSLNIIPGYPGTSSVEGSAASYPDRDIEPGTPLDLNTPLYPWKKDDGSWYTSNDLVDIENQLDYSYGRGSLDHIPRLPFPGRSFLGQPDAADIVLTKRVSGINRAEIEGSFVIRTFVTLKTGERVEIAREPILSRWEVASCANCKLHLDVESLVPIDETLMSAILGPSYHYAPGAAIDDKHVKYEVEIQTLDDKQKKPLVGVPRVGPLVKSL